MKIVEKDDEIFMRDIPATNWTYGVLSLFGVFLFGVAAFANPVSKAAGQPVGVWQAVSLGIAAFSFYLAYIKLSAPVITTRIKISAQTIDVTRRKFLIFAKTEQFHFSRIKRAEMVKRKPDRAFLYFSVLTLFDDSQIDLESSGNANEIVSPPLLINRLLKNRHANADKNRKNGSKDESKAEMR